MADVNRSSPLSSVNRSGSIGRCPLLVVSCEIFQSFLPFFFVLACVYFYIDRVYHRLDACGYVSLRFSCVAQSRINASRALGDSPLSSRSSEWDRLALRTEYSGRSCDREYDQRYDSAMITIRGNKSRGWIAGARPVEY